MTEEKITIKADETKKNNSWNVDEDHIRRMGEYIQKSIVGRLLYHLMKVLLFFEGVIWFFLDTVRSWRMKVAQRINSNYQRYR